MLNVIFIALDGLREQEQRINERRTTKRDANFIDCSPKSAQFLEITEKHNADALQHPHTGVYSARGFFLFLFLSVSSVFPRQDDSFLSLTKSL